MMRSNPWWSFMDHPIAARRAVDALFITYYIGLLISGATAFLLHPSPAITDAVQVGGALIWSGGTVAASLIAIVSRARRAVEAESIALATLAMLTLVHGVMFIIGTEGMTGVQTGARLLSAPLFMLAVVIRLRHPMVRVPAERGSGCRLTRRH